MAEKGRLFHDQHRALAPHSVARRIPSRTNASAAAFGSLNHEIYEHERGKKNVLAGTFAKLT